MRELARVLLLRTLPHGARVSRLPHKPGDDLCTPPHVLDLVRAVGMIERDPFPCEHDNVRSRWSNPVDWDAFAPGADWSAETAGTVSFSNPSYSRPNLPRFADAWALQIWAPMTHGIALVPSSTGAVWFRKLCDHSQAVAFWHGRIAFWKDGKATKGGGLFDSALFYAGPRPHHFADVFAGAARVFLLGGNS